MKVVSARTHKHKEGVKDTHEKRSIREKLKFSKIYNLFTETGIQVQSCTILLFIVWNCHSPSQSLVVWSFLQMSWLSTMIMILYGSRHLRVHN